MKNKRTDTKLHIAIDGANASGKDTIGSILAYRLNCFFIESGSIYRAAAWYILNNDIPLDNTKKVSETIKQCDFTVKNQSKKGKVVPSIWVNGRNITSLLRTSEIDMASSTLAKQPTSRQILIDLKKNMVLNFPRLIMTGRGIGRMVLPDADLKIYLTASLEVRAQRRYQQRKQKDPHITIEQIATLIRLRDKLNQERTFDPDIPSDDSMIIDTSDLNIEQVCQQIIDLASQTQSKH